MELLVLNGYKTPPPSKYDIEYSDVNGEKTQVEDGTTYIEQVRSDIPSISVGWTCLSQEQVTAITEAMAGDTVAVQYYYGEMKTAVMTTSERSLKLKFIDGSGKTYWNLSFTLEG